ncbi:EamA family transporter [Candidatus Roseilinea sp. NK_OTU-006]|nr:DMT family transporter [Candidatus Roseilinea sp. NK_OTU-006]
MTTPTTTLLERPSLSPALGIIIGVMAVSTASIFIRFAQQAGVNSLAIAALRLTIAALALLPFALIRCSDEFHALSGRDALTAAISGIFLGGHFATWILSLEFTSVVSSVVLVSLSPLFIAAASALFLKEPLTTRIIAGMVIAIAGGVLIGLSDGGGAAPGQNPMLGNALALVGALCMAPYLIIARALRNKFSLLAYLTLVYSAAAVVLMIGVLLSGTSLAADSPLAYLWIALTALVPQLIGHGSFNWSVRRLPAVYGAIPVMGEPVGSAILAMLVLGETLQLLTLMGAALALAGIALMSLKRNGA